MDKNQPYNEFDEQAGDLPLPDQEASWLKMKTLLDEEERKKRVIPPVFLNCAGWGALLLLLLAGAWFFLKPLGNEENNREEKNTASSEKTTPQQKVVKGEQPVTRQQTPADKATQETIIEKQKPFTQKTEQAGKTSNDLPGRLTTQGDHSDHTSASRIDKPARKVDDQQRTISKKPADKKPVTNRNQNVIDENIKSQDKEKLAIQTGRLKTSIPVKNTKDTILGITSDSAANSVDSTSKKIVVSDPVPNKIEKDSSTQVEEQTKKDNRKRKFVFHAGVGVQQQIPFQGQTSVPYNYYGRKGSISDYIPSVYLQLEREKKWFIMGEFRYGAPQSLKEFSFNKQTKFDTSTNLLSTTTLRIKKTYYHQLPLTFNYYIKDNWSVGLGGMYSRFYGAVTENETKNLNLQTQTESVTKRITRVQNFTDSFLYKTQLHFILQTDYQWKRFTLGLRYTKDLQPFIRYVSPDGNVNVEKNQSLQFILRYRLWSSRK